MVITIERAKEIQEAFGHCAIVYECMTPEEIVAEISGEPSEVKWCELKLSVESIHADRASFDGPEHYEEWKGMEKEIIGRLAEIGIEVESQA